jgi:hypothetical protein
MTSTPSPPRKPDLWLEGVQYEIDLMAKNAAKAAGFMIKK